MKEQETQKKFLSVNSNVLGSESANRIVFYDNNGVIIGTSLNDESKPQIDITVDEKTISKDIPLFVNTAKTLGIINAFFVNGWIKLIELISSVFDKIIG